MHIIHGCFVYMNNYVIYIYIYIYIYDRETKIKIWTQISIYAFNTEKEECVLLKSTVMHLCRLIDLFIGSFIKPSKIRSISPNIFRSIWRECHFYRKTVVHLQQIERKMLS